MLRITKQTDYGIMLLARMAELPEGQVFSARDAARWSGLSRPMVSKILKLLAREQILDSHRGAGGGYRLALPPEKTTVAGVIRALEGPISMVECGSHPGHCDQESTCPTRTHWARINREIELALERVPISEMLLPARRDLLRLGPDGESPAPAPPPPGRPRRTGDRR